MKRKIFGLIMVLAMIVVFVPCVSAVSIVDSGTCGENLTWTLDSDGLLTISGEGEMDNWSYTNPWKTYSYNDIKKVYIDNGVTSIGDYAFYYCRNMEEILISNTVTKIGERAFFGYCRNLTKIEIPYSVTEIGEGAFDGCSGLTEITLPEKITRIADNIFSNCSSLAKVTLPDKIEEIGVGAFTNCSSLSEIILPENITQISDDAFSSSGLTRITIPDGVTKIGMSAFSGCFYLTEIILPEKITKISDYAFYNCRNLTQITIPESITEIGEYSFYHCGFLEIFIPSNVSKIGRFAFYGDSLKSINANNDYYKSIDGVLFDREITGVIAYPQGKIDKSYVIPDGVEYIEEGAFWRCDNIIDMYMPSSVSLIKESAFGSFGLENIYYGGTEKEWSNVEICVNEDSQVIDNRILLGTVSPKVTINCDSTGIPVNNIYDADLKTDVNGKLMLDVNFGVKEQSFLIIVLYKDDMVSEMEITDVFEGCTSKTVSVTSNADTAKIFIWDSLEGMQPLCDAKEITIE